MRASRDDARYALLELERQIELRNSLMSPSQYKGERIQRQAALNQPFPLAGAVLPLQTAVHQSQVHPTPDAHRTAQRAATNTMPMLTGAGTVPIRVSGMPVPRWWNADTSAELQRLKPRSTDIILASWPKSGTHWVYRALRLLSLGVMHPDSSMTLAEMLPASRPSNGLALQPSPWNPTMCN